MCERENDGQIYQERKKVKVRENVGYLYQAAGKVKVRENMMKVRVNV